MATLYIRCNAHKAPHSGRAMPLFVDSLFRVGFHGNNIPVAVGLYARIRQAPFQNGVVVVYDFVRP